MSVPDFQSMMLPFLQTLGDGKEWFRKDIIKAVADAMQLTDEQRNLCYIKSSVNTLSNNIAWVEMNLLKANLILRPQRACYQITKAGQEILLRNPKSITLRFLRDNCPVYAQWLKTRLKKEECSESEDSSEIITKLPEDHIRDTYSIICSELAQDLLNQVKSSHWRFFERIVVDLLIKMGYGGSRQDAGKVVGKSGDNGIDGVINEDKLGLDVVYIQAKKHSEPVTISQVRDFAGALLAKKARKGVFITTSSFPKSAEDFVAQIEPKVILIDGQRLAALMIEYNVGVVAKNTYEIKKIDLDYFDENEL